MAQTKSKSDSSKEQADTSITRSRDLDPIGEGNLRKIMADLQGQQYRSFE